MGTKRCPYAKGTFRALQWASEGGLWIICKPCRRYRPLPMAADIAERQFTRTWFICKRCDTRGLVTGDDPAREPLWQGFEMDHGAVEAEQRRSEELPPPAPVWFPADDPRLETTRRRLIPIFAEIDHRHFLLVAWIETAWHSLHDGRPIEGTITRWRYWDGDTGARKALGL
jgi:hypothetical protein